MAMTRREEARALSADERDLVEKSHHPALRDLPDQALAELVRRMRERRERARTQAAQRRREMRGKAAPKGATRSRSDEGSAVKASVLAMAMRRLNNEAARRRSMASRASLEANAKKALALKRAGDTPESTFNSRHAHDGMRSAANRPPDDLIRPMERGRQRKAAAVAQAKRDARTA